MSPLHIHRLFFVALIACFWLAGCSEKKPESVVEDFFQAAAKGNHEKMMSLCDLSNFSPDDQSKVKEKAKTFFLGFKQKMDSQGGLSKIEVLSVEQGKQDEYGNYSDVSIRVTTSNGNTEEITYPAYQRGKEYKLIIPKEILSWNP